MQGVARVSKNGFTTFTGLQVGSITTTAGAVTPDKLQKYGMSLGIIWTHAVHLETTQWAL